MTYKNITPIQCRDTALALTFLLLLIWLFAGKSFFIYIAMGLVLAAMIWPPVMKPFAAVWFGFSHLLGQVMSRVLLTVIYATVLLPVAFVRQLMGKDSLHLRKWRSDTASAFIVREHTFTRNDLTHPF